MLVTVTNFGSVWRVKYRNDASTGRAIAAFFNTTGVVVHGRIRPRSKIDGDIRFNNVGGFTPHHHLGMINRVFDCEEPGVWQNRNRVLFKSVLSAPREPDFLLVVVKSRELGRLDLTTPWRDANSVLISFSEEHDQQEAMLLMRLDGWIRSDLGVYRLRPFENWFWSARLQLAV
jgi:hypothetical protein